MSEAEKWFESMVENTTKVANALSRKQGCQLTFDQTHAAIILLAYFTIMAQAKK